MPPPRLEVKGGLFYIIGDSNYKDLACIATALGLAGVYGKETLVGVVEGFAGQAGVVSLHIAGG